MRGRPGDWTATVRAHWRDVTAYIVSSDHRSCLRMAREEVVFIQRRMRHVRLVRIASLRPTLHWFMAVIVCPGDDLQALATWAIGKDAKRVHFYLHRDTELEALAPWRDAGHPLSRVTDRRFTAYGPLHALLGLDLSDQVYDDFAP